jgi:protein arginine kinase activator
MALKTRRANTSGRWAMQKCQKCSNPATLHITEVLSENQFEELHMCEQCASKYLYEPKAKGGAKGALEPVRDAEDSLFHQHECPACGIKFIEFRNTGRLGCPHDYQAFREELVPLLENIHGETKHCGKVPRRGQHTQEAQNELVNLRQRLKQAVTREDYEEAAKLRDRIKNLEETV